MVEIPCICPPKADGEPRHVSDTVTLRQTLDFRAALTIRNSVLLARSEDEEASVADILAVLTEQYLYLGVESWSLVDEKGKPVPVSRTAIRERLLAHTMAAITVGDAADTLYSEQVMLPLLAMASSSSPPTPTNGSTSPPKGSRKRRPTPSSPSSTTTSQMAATGTASLSPAGGSSF